jgi:hypothetical protein
MRPKRRIPAGLIVADIRGGMTNSQLMKRYQVSAGTLQKIFKKLQDANMIEDRDLDGRLLSPQEGVVHSPLRREQRCYTIMRLPITDMDNLDAECYVKDLTENGLQIVNLKARAGETKKLLIQGSEYADVRPFSFEAQCRWARIETSPTRHVAGFEITRISDDDLQQLREFIQFATFCG